ncbi:MAG: hypothetical protein Q9226_007087 [Calogaya cf. arnoldii]
MAHHRDSRQTLADLLAENKSLRNENERLRHERDIHAKVSAGREERNDALEHENARLKVNSRSLQEAIATLGSRLMRRDQEIEWLKRQVREKERQIDELRRDMQRLREYLRG